MDHTDLYKEALQISLDNRREAVEISTEVTVTSQSILLRKHTATFSEDQLHDPSSVTLVISSQLIGYKGLTRRNKS